MTDTALVHQKVNAIMVSLFEIEPEAIKPESSIFEDLGLDSLDAIDLVIKFQEVFGIKPQSEEVQKIRTMNDVYDLVQTYHNKNA